LIARGKRDRRDRLPLPDDVAGHSWDTSAMAGPRGGSDRHVFLGVKAPNEGMSVWLGHANPTTTQIYLDADLELKQRALDRSAPPDSRPVRYQPPDALLAFLEAL
jgi:hypothetical protein